MRRWRHCKSSAWATALAATATAFRRQLAVALVMGQPLVALQRAATPCGRTVGSRPLRPSRSRPCPRVAAPCSGLGRNRSLPCRGALAAVGHHLTVAP
ncbi:hypothetical protein B296_00025550 [Ensete ventricosum]|uniref:Secreted protein n=1 Tax=Ensete ventricosum TaxID=4639 RepID=A0A426YJL9_ENSVE|nr:hypothetical protein B296_00025550 [Ensete ventricosum]